MGLYLVPETTPAHYATFSRSVRHGCCFVLALNTPKLLFPKQADKNSAQRSGQLGGSGGNVHTSEMSLKQTQSQPSLLRQANAPSFPNHVLVSYVVVYAQ
jgi:hypothetical protein